MSLPAIAPLFRLLARAGDAAGGDGMPDAALVAAAQAGDREAFSQLVCRYRSRVHAVIVNMIRNEADAWDLTQEVFLKAWLSLAKFEGRSAFFTWLYRIAHNVTYDWLRRKRPEVCTGFDEDWQSSLQGADAPLLHASTAAPDHGLHRDDLRAALEAAMEKLSPDHRQAILLKEVQGLKYEEIASVMDCSVGTVMSRLFYARKKLQELLQPAYREFLQSGE